MMPWIYKWAPLVSKPCRCPRCLGPAEWLTDSDVADGVSYLIRCPVCNPDAGVLAVQVDGETVDA